ncbi:MAG: hypothetical protein ACREM3_00655 [Candidatus Rokuibacteriota bacterium]
MHAVNGGGGAALAHAVTTGTGWRRRAASLLVALVALTHDGCAIRPDWRAALEAAGLRFISARALHTMLAGGERSRWSMRVTKCMTAADTCPGPFRFPRFGRD